MVSLAVRVAIASASIGGRKVVTRCGSKGAAVPASPPNPGIQRPQQ